jgi:hypothetical protein
LTILGNTLLAVVKSDWVNVVSEALAMPFLASCKRGQNDMIASYVIWNFFVSVALRDPLYFAMIEWSSISFLEWLSLGFWAFTNCVVFYAITMLVLGRVKNRQCRYGFLLTLFINVTYQLIEFLYFYMEMDVFETSGKWLISVVCFAGVYVDLQVLTIFNCINERFSEKLLRTFKRGTTVIAALICFPFLWWEIDRMNTVAQKVYFD